MDTDGVVVLLLLTSSGLFVWFVGRRVRAGERHLIAGIAATNRSTRRDSRAR